MITKQLVRGLVDNRLMMLAVQNPKSKRVNAELRKRHLVMKAREYRFAFGCPKEQGEL